MMAVQTLAALSGRRLPNAGFQQRCSAVSRQRMHSRVQCPPRHRLAASHRVVQAAAADGVAVTLTLPCGTELAMPKAALVIGSAADADVRLEGSNIAPQHVRLEHKGGRLFCTALSGDPDLLLSATHCWLDGVELRPGVRGSKHVSSVARPTRHMPS